ncbi:class II aldolase/adducin family protein [Nonomuraea sp. NPDC050556]|uniref:class II aldolase/adducin family protein n=1 Tax=Nonomuraea sp. NPDC050556 TaxID=3364369 RepID=UPI00378F24A2
MKFPDKVVVACRVLAHQGLARDVLGHVSLRTPGGMLIRCRGPRERGLLYTSAEDIHEVPLDGPYDLPGGYKVPAELPIHAETLRRHPGVNAVVHAHPPALVAADLAGVPLLPIVGAYDIPTMRLVRDGVPVYPRAVLIRRADLAAEMLEAMGDRPVCVLRGHGVTVTGTTLAQAVTRAVGLEHLARLSLDVVRAGGTLRPLPEADLAELPDLGAALNEEAIWRYLEGRSGA